MNLDISFQSAPWEKLLQQLAPGEKIDALQLLVLTEEDSLEDAFDEMEEKGMVGPFQGSKPREILITKEQWATMRGNQPEQMELDDIPFDEGVPEELD